MVEFWQYCVLVTPLFVVEPLPPEPPPVLSPPPEPDPFELPSLVKSGGCPVADRCASIPSNVPTEPPMGIANSAVLTMSRNAMVFADLGQASV
ncbi:hypothetical protein F1880_003566 [Penicillium rolfsii]|nr:hypothetical protein F1880_003566 [Penicillium rolfsii]